MNVVGMGVIIVYGLGTGRSYKNMKMELKNQRAKNYLFLVMLCLAVVKKICENGFLENLLIGNVVLHSNVHDGCDHIPICVLQSSDCVFP